MKFINKIFPRTSRQISIKLGTKHSSVKANRNCPNRMSDPLQKGNDLKNDLKMQK
jgi:hypothetical protein